MKINAASLTPTTLEYSPLIFSSLTLVIDNNLLFVPLCNFMLIIVLLSLKRFMMVKIITHTIYITLSRMSFFVLFVPKDRIYYFMGSHKSLDSIYMHNTKYNYICIKIL